MGYVSQYTLVACFILLVHSLMQFNKWPS